MKAGDRVHNYLRAVGFSKIMSRVDFDNLVDEILNEAQEKQCIQIDDIVTFSEIKWNCNEYMGIALRGEYDENDKFHIEHYFPYYSANVVSTNDLVMINKRVDTDAYTGMCDDYRLGVSLIFYLQNAIDYMKASSNNQLLGIRHAIRLAALSIEGKILLPLDRTGITEKYKTLDPKYRNNLIAEAKKGNQEAIDSLTIDDIDLCAVISKRIKCEDLYSVVETSFIPYGSESDNYTIIGTIQSVKLTENKYTKEMLYELEVCCNDLVFQVCINKMDLQGEPLVGRRFKGNIWMQGTVQF